MEAEGMEPHGFHHQRGFIEPIGGLPSLAPNDDFVRGADLVRVIDGDTLRLKIDLGWDTSIIDDVRLARVNTPENRGQERSAGLWVTEQVKKWIFESRHGPLLIHSKRFTRGKFGRCIAEVWNGGQSLNQWLLGIGYGWPTDDDGQIVGPRDINRLKLPDHIKAEVRAA